MPVVDGCLPVGGQASETIGSEGARGSQGRDEDVCVCCFEALRVGDQQQEGTKTAGLDCCRHRFHLACILKWARVENSCPLCKLNFNSVVMTDGKRRAVKQRRQRLDSDRDEHFEADEIEDSTQEEEGICHVCLRPGLLLLCDGCDAMCHVGCAGLQGIPLGEWYCSSCSAPCPAPAPAPAVLNARENRSEAVVRRGGSAHERRDSLARRESSESTARAMAILDDILKARHSGKEARKVEKKTRRSDARPVMRLDPIVLQPRACPPEGQHPYKRPVRRAARERTNVINYYRTDLLSSPRKDDASVTPGIESRRMAEECDPPPSRLDGVAPLPTFQRTYSTVSLRERNVLSGQVCEEKEKKYDCVQQEKREQEKAATEFAPIVMDFEAFAKTSKEKRKRQDYEKRKKEESLHNGDSTTERDIEKIVREYVLDVLVSEIRDESLSSDEREELARKVSGKVVRGSTALQSNATVMSCEDFLTSKRKAKVRDIIIAYLSKKGRKDVG